MFERRQQPGFPVEPRQTLWIAGESRGQNLDRDVALQLGVTSTYTSPMPPRGTM